MISLTFSNTSIKYSMVLETLTLAAVSDNFVVYKSSSLLLLFSICFSYYDTNSADNKNLLTCIVSCSIIKMPGIVGTVLLQTTILLATLIYLFPFLSRNVINIVNKTLLLNFEILWPSYNRTSISTLYDVQRYSVHYIYILKYIILNICVNKHTLYCT